MNYTTDVLIVGLHPVEIIKWRIPINRDVSLAFGISTNKILFDDFTMKAASQRLFKGICRMKFIWRRRFKNPMAIWTFEGKFGCRHNSPSSYYYTRSRLKVDMTKGLAKPLDLKVLMAETAISVWWAMTTLAPKTLR